MPSSMVEMGRKSQTFSCVADEAGIWVNLYRQLSTQIPSTKASPPKAIFVGKGSKRGICGQCALYVFILRLLALIMLVMIFVRVP